MLRVISLSFIVLGLPELVKHILVAGVVRRNIKFSVKISNISTLLTLSTTSLTDDAVMLIRAESSS